ncbi:MAG: hypothetical protein ABJA98_30585 [Acidobacteriota bacterium]
MRWHTSLVVISLFTFLACGSPTAPKAAQFDQAFTLAPGTAAVLGTESLQAGFDQVLSDSRCPRGAQCIVAGDATVRVWLAKSPRGRENRELKTTPDGSHGVYDAYKITLITLAPSPEVGSTIRPTDYVATLIVTRSP